MKKSAFNFVFVLTLIIFTASSGIAQNLMINGDLESWTAGVPDGWTNVENITQESTIIHGGSYSAKHTSAQSTKDFQQVIDGIQGGQEYTISYWYMDNDPQARTRIWSYWLSGGSTLPDNADILRPSTYSEDNANWIQFNEILTAPATADGFRFEVRVYNQGGLFGGSVFYDDFEFTGDITIYPEPSNYPTDFTATSAGLSVNLQWTDAVGAQLPSAYIIMAGINPSLPVPVDGTPVPDDPDLSDGSGALNVPFGEEAASFGNLESNTTYYFSIYSYTNNGANIDFKTDGTAPTADATTSNITIIETENFDVSWGNWTTISVVGSQVWDRDNSYGIGGSPCASMTGYEGQPYENDDWLISPALNLDDYENEVLVFYNALGYTGPDLELKISTDYDGGGDPYSATWSTESFTFSTGYFEWTESGEIDLSVYNGSAVYVAFHFTSTDLESATWEVDDILITGEEDAVIDPEPSNYPTNFVANEEGSAIQLSWTDAIGDQLPDKYIILAGISASLPVPSDGTPIPDDTDLSDGSGAINIAFGIEETTFSNLDPATTYYFSIYPYTNSGVNIDYKNDGTAPTANATTSNVTTVVIEEENFDESWGLWTTVSVTGTQEWDRDNTWGIGDTPCASMTGYEGQPYENDDWLISPPLNLDDFTNEILVFYNAMSYTGPDMELKVSTDYDGGGDPYSATWSVESFTMSTGFFEWTESGEIDLSGYNGSAVYVAFHFTSTNSESATWEVDDIVITGEGEITIDPEPSNYPTNFSADANELSILLTWTDAIGDQLPDKYLIYAGTDSSLPVPEDGTPVANDTDLSDGSGALNVNFGVMEAMFSDLVPGTTYYFSIYPYTNSGANTDYKNDGTAPTGNATIEFIPEPSNYPTGFAAYGNATTIDLSWVDATGTQLPEKYIIFAGTGSSLPTPTDGIPTPDDLDLSDGLGAANVDYGVEEFTFSGLEPSTTYYFSIYPYTNSGSAIDYKNDGTAPAADATTEEAVTVVIESENFDESWGNWTTISVVGSQVWDRDNSYGIGGSPCASMTGYEGQPYENDDWLISPALDLDSYNNEILVFQNSLGYTGPELQLKISTDYDGGGDPYSATWSNESFTMSTGFFEWMESGEIDLSGYSGSAVYVAFQFTSTDSESATWEVDDIVITGEENLSSDDQLAIDDLFKVYPNPTTGMLYIEKPGVEFTDINIMSVTGNLVKSVVSETELTKIDLTGISKGIYIILFRNNETGQTVTRKLIVQ